jgi:hypothetical protein
VEGGGWKQNSNIYIMAHTRSRTIKAQPTTTYSEHRQAYIYTCILYRYVITRSRHQARVSCPFPLGFSHATTPLSARAFGLDSEDDGEGEAEEAYGEGDRAQDRRGDDESWRREGRASGPVGHREGRTRQARVSALQGDGAGREVYEDPPRRQAPQDRLR